MGALRLAVCAHPFAYIDVAVGMADGEEPEFEGLLPGGSLFLALEGGEREGRICEGGDGGGGVVDESAAVDGKRRRLAFPVHVLRRERVWQSERPKLFFGDAG